MSSKTDSAKILEVDIDAVEPNSYNPNAMSPEKMQMLAEDVDEEGMDQPVVVRENPDKKGKYIIVDGEHRWTAVKMSKRKKVLISVKDWDEATAKIHTVRRNLLRGDMDKAKFTKLVRESQKEQDIPLNDLRKRMGFQSEKEFHRLMVEDVDAQTDKVMEKMAKEVKDTTKNVSLVSEMVRSIIVNYGDNIPNASICFTYKGALVYALEGDKELADKLQALDTAVSDFNVKRNDLLLMFKVALDQITETIEEGE